MLIGKMEIKIKELQYYYQENQAIFKNLSVDFESQKITLIYGRSGSGKSTFLKCLCGLIKAKKGKIEFNNHDISMFNERKLADFRLKNIGFVYQFFHLLPSLTVKENILLPANLANLNAEQRCQELLEKYDIQKLSQKWPEHLSGGEAQRVALCRALINQAPVILADEPSGNLDRKNRDRVLKEFSRLRNEEEKSMIIVTHDEAFKEIADTILHLENGQLMKQ